VIEEASNEIYRCLKLVNHALWVLLALSLALGQLLPLNGYKWHLCVVGWATLIAGMLLYALSHKSPFQGP